MTRLVIIVNFDLSTEEERDVALATPERDRASFVVVELVADVASRARTAAQRVLPACSRCDPRLETPIARPSSSAPRPTISRKDRRLSGRLGPAELIFEGTRGRPVRSVPLR